MPRVMVSKGEELGCKLRQSHCRACLPSTPGCLPLLLYEVILSAYLFIVCLPNQLVSSTRAKALTVLCAPVFPELGMW